MSRPRGPEFEELVGEGVGGEERERLRRAHELLLAAGPPPELSPELEAGPTLAMTLGRRPSRHRRRLTLLLAAALAVLVVFLGGYVVGNRGGGSRPAAVQTLSLRGTSDAPNALASLRVDRPDGAGNWPMTLSVTGLPSLPPRGYYEVYLVRNGRAWAQCGTFRVRSPGSGVTVRLNAPYGLRPGDTWIVTKLLPGGPEPGPTVLRPVA